MARKKAAPVEEQEPNLEAQGLPEGEAVTGEGEFQEGLSAAPSEEGNPPEGAPIEESSPAEGLPEPLEGEGASVDGLPEDLGELGDTPTDLPGPMGEEAEGSPSDAGSGETIPSVPSDILPEGGKAAAEVPEGPPGGEAPPELAAPPETAAGSEEANNEGFLPQDAADPPPEALEAPAEAETSPAEPLLPKTDRQSFYGLNFNELDRDLTAEER